MPSRYPHGISILTPEKLIDALNGEKLIKGLGSKTPSLLPRTQVAAPMQPKMDKTVIFNRKIRFSAMTYDLHQVLTNPAMKQVCERIKKSLDDSESLENWQFLGDLLEADLILDVAARSQALNEVRKFCIEQINISSELKNELAKKGAATLMISDFEPAVIALVALINENLRASNSNASAASAGPETARHRKYRSDVAPSEADLRALKRMSNPSATGSSGLQMFTPRGRTQSQVDLSRKLAGVGNTGSLPVSPTKVTGISISLPSGSGGSAFLAPKSASGTGSVSPSLSSAGSLTPTPLDTSRVPPVNGAGPAAGAAPVGWMFGKGASVNRSPKSADTDPVITPSA